MLREGFRAATMEGIAKEASIAKATLYAYFPDKENIFKSVAEAMAQEMVEGFRAELHAEASPVKRVIAALQAKHRYIFETVRASAQADELFAAKNQLAKKAFAEADQQIVKNLAELLETEALGAWHPHETASLLFYATLGVANHAATNGEMEEGVRRLVQAILGV